MNLLPGRDERDSFKHIFLSTAAASSLLLAVAAVEPAVFSWATKAEAATNNAASINFYDELAPHGNWVSYQNRYVWIPDVVNNVLTIDNIETRTRKKVVALEEKPADNPVVTEPDARPKKIAAAPADKQAVAVAQAPAEPKPALPPAKTVGVDTVGYDQSGNIVFGGRGPVGSEVQLYVDNNPFGLAGINDMGTWTFAGIFPLTVGTHTLRAQEIGRNGAVKSRIEMPFYREDPAKVARASPTPITPEAPKPAGAPKSVEVATTPAVPAPTPPVDTKTAASEPAAPVELKKGATTASIDQPDTEKTVKGPSDESMAPVKMKKGATTASIDQITVEAPADEPKAPVELKKKEVTASIEQPDIEKIMQAPADEPAAPVEIKKKEATTSIEQPDMEKIMQAPAKKQAAPVEIKKKEVTASIEQPDMEKTVKAPSDEPMAPVEMKKGATTASIDQKTVEAPANEPKAPVELKKKEVTASIEQPDIEKIMQAPAKKQAALIENGKKKKAEALANKKRKGQPACDPALADCPPAQTLSKAKLQSAKDAIPKTILRDTAAESWKVNCSPMFGGFSKTSETYLSNEGKRVSCAWRPKIARG